MEQARKSGLGMDTGNKSYFSMSGLFGWDLKDLGVP